MANLKHWRDPLFLLRCLMSKPSHEPPEPSLVAGFEPSGHTSTIDIITLFQTYLYYYYNTYYRHTIAIRHTIIITMDIVSTLFLHVDQPRF